MAHYKIKNPIEEHHKKILIDAVKNPIEAYFLNGWTFLKNYKEVSDYASKILRDKYNFSPSQISKLERI
jgi:hypothetical protein